MATKLDHIYGVGGQIGNLGNRLTSLENNAAKKNEANNFTQPQTLPNLNLKTNGNEAKFIDIRNGSTRVSFIGKGSASNNDITVSASDGNVVLDMPNAKVAKIKNPEFTTHVRAGFGGNTVEFTPDGNSTKTLKFKKTNFGKFNLDLDNDCKIINVPNPTANNDVANKAYVDSKHPQWTLVGEYSNQNFRTKDTYWTSNVFDAVGKYELMMWIKQRSDNKQMTIKFHFDWQDRNNVVYSEVVPMNISQTQGHVIGSAPNWYLQLTCKISNSNPTIALYKSGVEASMPTNCDLKLWARKVI